MMALVAHPALFQVVKWVPELRTVATAESGDKRDGPWVWCAKLLPERTDGLRLFAPTTWADCVWVAAWHSYELMKKPPPAAVWHDVIKELKGPKGSTEWAVGVLRIDHNPVPSKVTMMCDLQFTAAEWHGHVAVIADVANGPLSDVHSVEILSPLNEEVRGSHDESTNDAGHTRHSIHTDRRSSDHCPHGGRRTT